MTGVIKMLSSNMIGVFVVTFVLLLGALYWQDTKLEETRKELKEAVAANITLSLVNTSLNLAITSLKEEIESMTNKHIELVKDVEKELCKGRSSIDQIINLKNLKSAAPTIVTLAPQQGGNNSEKSYVDIDGKLPPDLLRLLQ